MRSGWRKSLNSISVERLRNWISFALLPRSAAGERIRRSCLPPRGSLVRPFAISDITDASAPTRAKAGREARSVAARQYHQMLRICPRVATVTRSSPRWRAISGTAAIRLIRRKPGRATGVARNWGLQSLNLLGRDLISSNRAGWLARSSSLKAQTVEPIVSQGSDRAARLVVAD